MIVLDAPAVVHMILPAKATDCQQYIDHHFIPHIASVISKLISRLISYGTHTLIIRLKLRPNTDQVPLVQKLLLQHPRLSLTTGETFWEMQKIRCNFSGTYPKLSKEHLRNVHVYSKCDDTKLINSSDQQSAAEAKTIMPCKHQEDDSRIFLHLHDAAKHGQAIQKHSSGELIVMLLSLRLVTLVVLVWQSYG